jgi:perosamine synthetase
MGGRRRQRRRVFHQRLRSVSPVNNSSAVGPFSLYRSTFVSTRTTIFGRTVEMIAEQWVPPNQLGVGFFQVSARAKRYVNDVLDSGRLSYGPLSKRFETEFAALHDRRHAVLSNSGTSSLHVALAALAEKYEWAPEDQVILPAVTFVASANTIIQAGLEPVFVDVDPLTYNLDPASLLDAITERTKAIMPVHLCGLPADMTRIMEVAERHSLRVIEDACETGFVRTGEKPVGSYGDVACFSTYVAHLIVTGVGGLSVTDDAELATIMRSLCNHGRDSIYLSIDDDAGVDDLDQVVKRRFHFTRIGFSYRITELEAALGLAALETHERMLAKRKENAGLLSAGLHDLEERQLLQLPRIPPYADHAFMMYPIAVTADNIRDNLMLYLERHNIETRPLMPLINQPIYIQRYGNLEDRYPVARYLNAHAFYIGCHQGFGQREISYICDVIASYFAAPREPAAGSR